MSKKICISGYYGFDNFGDETILKILVENLRKSDKSPEITVFSSNPQKTASSINVKSVQNFNLKSVFKELYSTDCLISGGGSLLQDSTSKKSLIYYLLVLFLAQFLRKKTIIFAQGIGPINCKTLKFITMRILKKADYITVRDNNSLKMLKDYGIKAELCSDPVWNIPKIQTERTNKLGIQLRSFKNIDDKFISELANGVNKYFSEREIILLSLQNKLDIDILSKFKQKLSEVNPSINVKLKENSSNDELIQGIAGLKELIAMRYHANLIAIKNNVKILPISYDIKVKNLADDFCIDCINPEKAEETDQKLLKFKDTEIKYNQEKINALKYDFEKLLTFI